MRRFARAALLGPLLGCAIVAPAQAAVEVSRVDSRPLSNESSIIVADVTAEAPGAVNNVQVGLAPDFPADYRITDTDGIQGTIPPFCLRESGNSVRCATTWEPPGLGEPVEVTRIFVKLGGADDSFGVIDPRSIPPDVLLEVWGGSGNDEIYGRRGGGREELNGDEPTDFENPGVAPGDDVLATGAPEDGKQLDGGGGSDVIVIVVNHGAKGFMAATEPAIAAKKATVSLMLGEGGNDRIKGGPRNDRINGGPGRDRINGKGGKDIIDCGPGKGDLGIGGPGRDLGRNCETVKH